MKKVRYVATIIILVCIVISQSIRTNGNSKRERNNDFNLKNNWIVGANFIPSTAINQIEMWQAETFDSITIDKELGWAESIGMNCMRVYLHHVVWEVDKEGFKNRLNKYLEIAASHKIKTIFVFFDDCWNATYKAGKQPDPEPGIHNSGWVRDPGDLIFQDSSLITILKAYVKDIMTSFKNDDRILMWDLYNEPGNSGYGNRSLLLLKKVFEWAKDVGASQPLTSGVWSLSMSELNKFQIENSDIITYHNYEDPEKHKAAIDSLKRYGRYLICTEYMARSQKSRFDNVMPLLKREHIGAINWGLVSGKTNTKYGWDKPITDGSEPSLWFHDIFYKDGTPYRKKEIQFIKTITSKTN